MTTTGKSEAAAILVPTIAEVPRISDVERRALRASLDQSREEIAAGTYDIVTSKTLRAEFDGIFRDDMSDDDLDAQLAARPASER